MRKFIVTLGFVCLAASAHAQIKLGLCSSADRYQYRESDLQSIVDGLDTSIALTDTFVVADETPSGACLFNPAEIGVGHRFSAEFRVTNPILLRNNVTVSFLADGDGSDPFLLQLEVAAGDVVVETIRPADISIPCLGLDRNLTGTIEDVKVQLVYRPPSPGNNTFRLEAATASFGTITVRNPDATIPAFAPITTIINAVLGLSSVRSNIDGILESNLRSQSYVTTTLPASLAQLFWFAAPGSQGSASICSVTLGAPPPFSAGCTTADCAQYRIRP